MRYPKINQGSVCCIRSVKECQGAARGPEQEPRLLHKAHTSQVHEVLAARLQDLLVVDAPAQAKRPVRTHYLCEVGHIAWGASAAVLSTMSILTHH